MATKTTTTHGASPLRFSLIIITKDRPGPLRAALESAARSLPPDGEVIVVDGDPLGSAASVVEELRGTHGGLSLRYLASVPGTAYQRNVGIDAALGDVVVFVDDDCTFEAGLFEALAGPYQDPAVVGVTGRVDQPRTRRLGTNPRLRWLLLGGGRQGAMTSYGFRREIFDLDRPRDVEFMPGPLMSARREVAERVRFDERLTGYALGEDDDFSYRVSRCGRVRYEPSASVFHRKLGWMGGDKRQIDRLRVVNRTYLFRKNFPQTLRARTGFVMLLAVLCAHRVLTREWSGLHGLLDGIKHVRRSPALLSDTHLADAEHADARQSSGAV